MTQNPSEFATALIAIASALVGGLVVAGATILTERKQRKHDEAAERDRRSYESSGRCLAALTGLHQGFDIWRQDMRLFSLASDRCNAFQAAVAVDGEAILDEATREILWTHSRLATDVLMARAAGASPGATQNELIAATLRHSDATRAALTCFRRQEPHPPYTPPDLTNVEAILAWRSSETNNPS